MHHPIFSALSYTPDAAARLAGTYVPQRHRIDVMDGRDQIVAFVPPTESPLQIDRVSPLIVLGPQPPLIGQYLFDIRLMRVIQLRREGGMTRFRWRVLHDVFANSEAEWRKARCELRDKEEATFS